MKNATFFWIVLILASVAAWAIFEYLLPEFIQHGGPLVIVLIVLMILVVTLVFERILSLSKAAGRGSSVPFLRDVLDRARAGDVQGAIELCEARGGTMAGILAAALHRYDALNAEGIQDRRVAADEVEHAIDEAKTLETPALERNLTALSTIASIATMVGLLGTTIGMIRSFAALAHAGAPDATQLSLGISEALINTAGGLNAAILAIVAYNYFTTKVDGITQTTEEAGAALMHALGLRSAAHARTQRHVGASATSAPGIVGA